MKSKKRKRTPALPTGRELLATASLLDLPVVSVTWMDASSSDAWREVSEARESPPLEVTTVGRLLHRDKQRLCLVSSVASNGAIVGTMQIPTACVRKIKRLRI